MLVREVGVMVRAEYYPEAPATASIRSGMSLSFRSSAPLSFRSGALAGSTP